METEEALFAPGPDRVAGDLPYVDTGIPGQLAVSHVFRLWLHGALASRIFIKASLAGK